MSPAPSTPTPITAVKVDSRTSIGEIDGLIRANSQLLTSFDKSGDITQRNRCRDRQDQLLDMRISYMRVRDQATLGGGAVSAPTAKVKAARAPSKPKPLSP